MIKVTMLIPIRDNGGKLIDPRTVEVHLHNVLTLCGGYTRSSSTLTGAWVDSVGKIVFDTLYSVTVCCEEDKLPDLRTIASQIAKTCRQDCLYLDYQFVTLEFIKPC